MARRIYLDHSATSPLDPRVAETMAPLLGASFGNPSSLHEEGRRARAAVDLARTQVASLLRAEAAEILFTSGGTEAVGLALRGLMERDGRAPGHLVVSAIEHPAVLETCRHLARLGAEATLLPVDSEGMTDPDDLRRVLRADTHLVSVMAASNVVGTLQPIGELARVAHDHGALFHTDAVQAAGKLSLDVRALGVDLLSLSAHKFHGPPGAGALFVRKGIELEPLLHGGGQERGLRSGTENVAAIAGLGRAAEIAGAGMAEEAARLVGWRDHILEETLARVPGAYLIGHRYRRPPGHLCLGFEGLEGEAIKLLLALDERGIAVSSGSACSAHHADRPSHVLQAMGFDPIRARGSLRVTLGRFNTSEEIGLFLEALPEAVATLRPLATHPI